MVLGKDAGLFTARGIMLFGSEGMWPIARDMCMVQIVLTPRFGVTHLGFWIQRCVTFHWNGPPPTRVHEYTGVCQNKQSSKPLSTKIIIPCHQVAGSILHTGQCHNSEELGESYDAAVIGEGADTVVGL